MVKQYVDETVINTIRDLNFTGKIFCNRLTTQPVTENY